MNEPLQHMPCGCTYRGERWVQMCPAHEEQSREVFARWALDHKRREELEDLLS